MSSSTDLARDPGFELKRVSDERTFYRKMRIKRLLYRLVGDVYVGRRAKLAHYKQWLDRLPLPPRPRIVELGSGDGVFAFYTANRMPSAEVVGLELNPIEAAVCERLAREAQVANLNFQAGTLGDAGWRSEIDFMYCLDVLEHIEEDIAVMRQMLDALVPGGTLLVHVPNRTYEEVEGTRHTVVDEDAWKINAGHVRNGYDPEELAAKLKSVGFVVREVKQTQGRPIARAHRMYHRFERLLAARLAILPFIDRLIRQDLAHTPDHGNTVWALATRPDTKVAPAQ